MSDFDSPNDAPTLHHPDAEAGDAWIEEALRALPRDAVADAGFTAAVMARLPAPRSAATAAPAWRLPVVALIWIAAALAAAVVLPETLQYALHSAASALAHVRVTPTLVGAVVGALAAGAWASAWFAVREE
jgi:hypothetical protein